MLRRMLPALVAAGILIAELDRAGMARACQERLGRELQIAVTDILWFINKAFRNRISFFLCKTVDNSH